MNHCWTAAVLDAPRAESGSANVSYELKFIKKECQQKMLSNHYLGLCCLDAGVGHCLEGVEYILIADIVSHHYVPYFYRKHESK